MTLVLVATLCVVAVLLVALLLAGLRLKRLRETAHKPARIRHETTTDVWPDLAPREEAFEDPVATPVRDVLDLGSSTM
jgi:hypothetical protein